MCLRFVFLLITRTAAWLRLSRRKEAWKTAEILLLRHQLTVLKRQQPRRPDLNWADRALLAVIPKARRQGLRLLVTAPFCGNLGVTFPQATRRGHWRLAAQGIVAYPHFPRRRRLIGLRLSSKPPRTFRALPTSRAPRLHPPATGCRSGSS